jgi:hypothetical protein
VIVCILTAKGKEHEFLEQPIRQIIPIDLMWEDPRLDLPCDAAEAVAWPLHVAEEELNPTPRPNKFNLAPSLKSLPPKTTNSRVDEDIAVIGRLIGDELGPTTRSRVRQLKQYDEDEVKRLVQQEALYSAGLEVIEEENNASYVST